MILVTGANKGLGRETARRLIAEGHDVWAGARDPERGRAVAEELGARPLVLDVTDDASVDSAAQTLLAAHRFNRKQQSVTFAVQRGYFALDSSRARVTPRETALKAVGGDLSQPS